MSNKKLAITSLVVLFVGTLAYYHISSSSKDSMTDDKNSQLVELSNSTPKEPSPDENLPVQNKGQKNQKEPLKPNNATDEEQAKYSSGGTPMPPNSSPIYATVAALNSLKSANFNSMSQWESAYADENYSEEGYQLSEHLRYKILNSDIVDIAEKSELTLSSIECKTTMCRIAFEDSRPNLNGDARIHPKLLPPKSQDGKTMVYAIFFDENSNSQIVYSELCSACPN
jgi:type IV secretory pathway VirB10-like protein